MGVRTDPVKLREDITRTRAAMSGTIDEIHGKLNPGILKEQALAEFHELKSTITSELRDARDSLKLEVKSELDDAKTKVREATIGKVEKMVHDVEQGAKDRAMTIADTVKSNPIPAALAGVGIAWLLFNATSGRNRRYRDDYGIRVRETGDGRFGYGEDRTGYGYGEESNFDESTIDKAKGMADSLKDKASGVAHDVGDKATELKQRAGDMAHRAQEKMSSTTHMVGEKMSSASHMVGEKMTRYASQARDRGRRVETKAEQFYGDNPLMVGAAFLAVGAAIGMAIPRTRREDELLGEYRDDVFDKAKSFAGTAIGKVNEATEKAANDIQKSFEPQKNQQQASGGDSHRGTGQVSPQVGTRSPGMNPTTTTPMGPGTFGGMNRPQGEPHLGDKPMPTAPTGLPQSGATNKPMTPPGSGGAPH